MSTLYELVPSKLCSLVCAPIEDSDQPAYLCSLIRGFDGRSIGSQENKDSDQPAYPCSLIRGFDGRSIGSQEN